MEVKHFSLSLPTDQQRLRYGEPLFLSSEDGLDWYEIQTRFAADKTKIMYDSQGVIRGITHDASVFFPVGMSVADIDNLPPNCSNDGSWCYCEGKVMPNPIWSATQARKQQVKLLHDVRQAMLPIITASALNTLTAQQREHLLQLQAFELAVSTIDITEETAIGLIFPTWPKEIVHD